MAPSMATSDWQPELFQEFQQPPRPRWWARYWKLPRRYVLVRLAHEDCVLLAIGALMVVVLGFCLGVERGKLIVAMAEPPPAKGRSMDFQRAAPAAPIPAVPPSLGPGTLPTTPNRAPATQPTATTSGTRVAQNSRYVVQAASFTDRDSAAQAQAQLSRQGHRATVALKGRYHVLFVEGFRTYAQATEAASLLRKTYGDCFVRKVSS